MRPRRSRSLVPTGAVLDANRGLDSTSTDLTGNQKKKQLFLICSTGSLEIVIWSKLNDNYKESKSKYIYVIPKQDAMESSPNLRFWSGPGAPPWGGADVVVIVVVEVVVAEAEVAVEAKVVVVVVIAIVVKRQ